MQLLILLLIIYAFYRFFKYGKIQYKENQDLEICKSENEKLQKEINELREKYYSLKFKE